MRLTSYQKFLVERYITQYYDLSIKDYCEKHCKVKTNIDHFTKWFNDFKIKDKTFPNLVEQFNQAITQGESSPIQIKVSTKPQPPGKAASNFVLSEKAKELIEKYTYFFNMYYHCFSEQGYSPKSNYSFEELRNLVEEYTFRAAYEGIQYFKKNPLLVKQRVKRKHFDKTNLQSAVKSINTFSAFEINQHSMGVVLVNGDKTNE